MRTIIVVSSILALCVGPAFAETPKAPAAADTEAAEAARIQAILDDEHPQFGDVSIPEAGATLHLGKDYYFLPKAEARQMLTEGWHNPPEAVDDVLGVVIPAGKTFMDETWGAVVTFDASGFVTDEEPSQKDYDQMISDVQSGEEESNKALKEKGFEPSYLRGWAQSPTYDKARHTLIWARDIQFGDEPDHTLNYDLRILGRKGVLSINLVDKVSRLNTVHKDAEALGARANFNIGSRFEDFKKGVDKATGYGLAGLVGAGLGLAVAQKAGLLGVILLFAKKGLVLILAGFAAIASRFRKLFGLKEKPSAVKASEEVLAGDPPSEST